MTRNPELGSAYRHNKNALLAKLRASNPSLRSARRALRELAALADGTLRSLWHSAGFKSRCALVAVGGYGRAELFPYSDVDVLLLLPDGADLAAESALKEQIGDFVRSCWDVGLEIGSSVRNVRQCLELAATDVTIRTALLDARRICGSRTLFAELRARYDAQMDPLKFLVAKQLEMRERHQKFGDTPYALEPNCKESPGGLRDLQLILWAARAARLGTRWEDLRASGLLTAHEFHQVKHNEALLVLLRTRLHLVAGRHEDRLVFDLQAALAESFKLEARTVAGGRVALRASEVLMRRYYWAAKATMQLRQVLLQLIEERLRSARGFPPPALRRINERFLDSGGLLEVADEALYRRTPHAILETFLIYARIPGIKGLSAHTLRALYNARTIMGREFRNDPVNHAQFLALLRQEHGVTGALRMMNATSVLGRYLWVFRRIVGQMQHDLFHAYTVDQHILNVVRNIRRFFSPEHTHEYPLCSRLAAGWDKPWVLCVAALFHDIAKGRGGNHSALGAQEARRFCAVHGIEEADAELIEFLVREHLSMSRVAQQEDLSDSDVIRAFAERMKDVRHVTGLYLLTVADIRATGPTIWTDWKGKLLGTLYQATAALLGGWAPSPSTLIEARKQEALEQLQGSGTQWEQAEALWRVLDTGYFLRHDASELAWHASHIVRARNRPDAPTKTWVHTRPSGDGGAQVLIYTRDRPELFARICAFFGQSSCSILDARVHTTHDGQALDTFEISGAAGSRLSVELLGAFETRLARALDATTPLPPPFMGRVSARARSFPIRPRVEINPDAHGKRWLLTVSTSDRTGLLYGIARVLALHGASVETSKITTLGDRVEDVFLLQGKELENAQSRLAIERDLVELLDTTRTPSSDRTFAPQGQDAVV
ncbi:MAG: [protein-PII] uridylyltransferase [Burkholderiaceae bacterium]|nr:MAG: [protein-PII] uridylyltransferase [Burkholderiaceae bacterium]